MKLLITGGAGFIGSHLAEFYHKRKHEIFIIDNLSTGHRDNIEFIKNENFFENDILDHEFVRELIKKEQFDVVIHLAATVSVVETIKQPVLSQKVNIEATVNLLQANYELNKNIKKFVFASSAAIYGNNDVLPQQEKVFIDPQSPYAIQKYAGEQYTKLYYKLYGVPTTALRFFNVYGPRQDPSSPYSGVISIMNKKYEENQTFTFFGDGKQSRDFVFINDLINAISIVIDTEDSNGEIYNLGTGIQTNLLEIFDVFSEKMSKKIDYTFVEEREGDIRDSFSNIDKLKKLGYSPKYTIEDGLSKYIEYNQK
ncbi:NAD-dependent epimerase/dehydratase family protein [Mammaliicoccus sciuri]|uniref:NAD-dependent epimerase/dehydratase family protein n=1 Tax=Mammaliicoccus sciuri TaxID=1296 RepID=UPI00195365F9|nr:NAD-dependent epimerase/dehydratase family protein [Mammaliicoccus sciuri]